MHFRPVLMKVCVALFLCVVNTNALGSQCENANAQNAVPWTEGGAVVFRTQGLAVDADGAPDSYLIDGKGLSDICNGVVAIVDGKRVTPRSDPDHWMSLCAHAWADALRAGDYSHVAIFGFLTNNDNKPVVQQAGDPLPGKAYISVTTMPVLGTPDRTQRHWVDARQIPYIVLSSSVIGVNHIKVGDVAAVYRPKTASLAFGIFADEGELGEASVKLHRDLGHEPVSKGPVARANIGIGDTILTVVFPGINVPGTLDAKGWNSAIVKAGKDALQNWGGLVRLQSCTADAQR